MTSKTHPDGSQESWTYNEAGHMTSHTDTLGRTTAYTLDAKNLVTRVEFPDGTFESFQHNTYGQVLCHRQRNGGVATYAFDATGLLTQSTDALGRTARTEYHP